eukprot:TRINITY_DN5462_c0_g1_i1.p2 TRINITY_DN5462_c0_g1~~TRINITY_DN5462_c0_g1_i1.p2  ORF type:complete len:425 (+),score=106.65 TRINITY_DN5462_c0_g1_i1:83-1357(+)
MTWSYSSVPIDAPHPDGRGFPRASTSPRRASLRLSATPSAASQAGESSNVPGYAGRPLGSPVEAEVRSRLDRVRGDVRRSIEGIERTLLGDIESALVQPQSSWAAPERAGGPPDFQRVRRQLVAPTRLPQSDQVTQTHLPASEMRVAGANGHILHLGAWCMVRPEWEVRRLCSAGAAAWHDSMARYCGGQAIGRVVFAKPGCDSVDVAFPDGTAWLFPAAGLQYYAPPQRLDDLQGYPVPPADEEPEQAAFLDGLSDHIRKREFMNQVNELQTESVRGFVEIYRQEARERRQLSVACHELVQMVQVEHTGAPHRTAPWNVPPPPRHRSPQRINPDRPGAAPTPLLSRRPPPQPLRFAHTAEPSAPPPQPHGPLGGPADSWEIAGVTPDGHYVYRPAPAAAQQRRPARAPPQGRSGVLAAKEDLL